MSVNPIQEKTPCFGGCGSLCLDCERNFVRIVLLIYIYIYIFSPLIGVILSEAKNLFSITSG